jgi:uncharacterized protein YndB with AHSA1/START domain
MRDRRKPGGAGRAGTKFTVSGFLPATPRTVYDAWLDSRAHSAMTGARATASTWVGGRFSAWDGYATGENLELVPGKRIVQSWRTADFADADPDSRIALTLKPVKGGTKLILLHTRLARGNGYKSGWQEFYLAPMHAWFAAKKR